MWQKKAHLQAHKESIASTLHQDQFVTTAATNVSPSLAHYGTTIPDALANLPTLIEQATQIDPPPEPLPMEPPLPEPPPAEPPVQVQEEPPQHSFLVSIAPTGQT